MQWKSNPSHTQTHLSIHRLISLNDILPLTVLTPSSAIALFAYSGELCRAMFSRDQFEALSRCVAQSDTNKPLTLKRLRFWGKRRVAQFSPSARRFIA